MTDLARPALALCLGLGLAFGAVAQEAPAPEAPPANATVGDAPVPDGLSMGQEPGAAPDGPGTTYVRSTHGDWELRCIRVETGTEPCQLYQLLQDAEGNSVAEISMFALPAGQQAAAGATIIAPLETLLTEQLSIKVDSAAGKLYPFTWCSQIGCVSRVGFTGAEVDGFRRGAKATVTIVPVVAPDERVELDLSLIGFTAGFAAVTAAMAPN